MDETDTGTYDYSQGTTGGDYNYGSDMPVDATDYSQGGGESNYNPRGETPGSGSTDPLGPGGGSGWTHGKIGGSIGGSGGGSANQGSQLNYQLGMAQLQQQIAEWNQTQTAQQTSAQQSGQGIAALVNEYNQTYAQAVNQYTQDYNKMLGIASTTSGQQAADIRAQYAQQGATGMQNLQRLGLGNTTLSANNALGAQRGQSAALNTLADQQQAIQLGIIGGHKTNAQLAPDISLLQTAIGQGQNASGVYGGTIGKALTGIQAPPQQGG